MQKLDKFSKFEKGIYEILAYLSICIISLIVVFIGDKLLLAELPSLIRYPLWAGLFIFGFILSLLFSLGVESKFRSLRAFLGKKPLQEIEEEISEKKLKREEQIEEWFRNLPEKDQYFHIWKNQKESKKILELIENEISKAKTFLLLIFILIIIAVIKLY